MSQYILVVDDQFAVRLFIQKALEESGYQVKAVASGSECLSLATSVPRPALILLDQSMPGMTGLQVLAQLVQDERAKHIPVIMISAEDDFEDAARSLGVRDLLSKPLDLDYFLETVEATLKRENLRNVNANCFPNQEVIAE
ncbi:response regulator with CheY-like receiver, AAA-type ATPase, and DNA-binding domains [Desulfosporosinus acidiphilus SJ4]|uniref:Stage 0 sporulation protein A homolog n=1 Tax=Desulfosporosinus acidiphilus (strain DSM 22704 / JCM 16185 / SJ4) TaxID=646529 RepID=I4D301_DESAJ|nr:response regulator [Desulfosporosinus acidiphilus]AFM40175.1 response regulator with CheY-like receiver, AAA-type ATPase, and DNA-binding domains [Desulfosporosinus acidiphilus SJ4]